jgi:hypothetical protein
MSNGWENHEPAPIEFLHGKIMSLFHEWRNTKTTETDVVISGGDLNAIIAKAKTETYEKYAKLQLKKPILKTEI